VLKHSILIVDDEPTIRDLLREILEFEGFTVLVAPSGVAALHLLQQTSVSLVLTDLMMPYLNGIDLARRLRADPRTTQIPLILMSAALPSDISDMFVDILPKPFPIEDVVHMIQRHIEG
jgi:CheY-like chemotaxis protein